MNPVTQEHPYGCAVACAAALCGMRYTHALKLFTHPSAAAAKGYYCTDICAALLRNGKRYRYGKLSPQTRKQLERAGTIAFIARSKKYPAGHYLLKTEKGWMNPWINFPAINPARSGFQKRLPGRVQWVIYEDT